MTAHENFGLWRVPATPESVPQLRRMLVAVLRDQRFDDAAVALAVTEALSNVVLHAYPGGEGSVTLSVTVADSDLVVVVSDRGVGSSHGGGPARARVGMGVAVIRELSDQVTINTDGDGTIVTMHFTASDGASRVPGM